MGLKKIAGKNVSVDEQEGKGTVINVGYRRAPAGCRDMHVTLAGLMFDCGCITVPGELQTLTDVNMNQTYLVPLITVCTFWSLAIAPADAYFVYTEWNAGSDCTGTFFPGNPGQLGITVTESSPGVYDVLIGLTTTVSITIFQGSGAIGAPMSNTVTCDGTTGSSTGTVTLAFA
jgi:hypothetical protein